MYISLDDGVAVFATHFIRIEGARENLAPFQCEKDGIVVYSEEEKTKAESMLTELGIFYAIETLDYQTHKGKAQGVKYGSRTEAIEHLLNDKEPQSQIIPNLKKKLEEEKNRNDNLEKRLAQIETKVNKGGV